MIHLTQEKALMLAPTYFWPYVEKTETCWIFNHMLMGKIGDKRGALRWKERGKWILIKAHRFSYILHHGILIEGDKVLHKCDNLLCVNPEDLFKGTQKDNIMDMVNKKRHIKGENHPSAKLTMYYAREIREQRKMGSTYEKLAKRYNVSPNTIAEIITNKIWKEENA